MTQELHEQVAEGLYKECVGIGADSLEFKALSDPSKRAWLAMADAAIATIRAALLSESALEAAALAIYNKRLGLNDKFLCEIDKDDWLVEADASINAAFDRAAGGEG